MSDNADKLLEAVIQQIVQDYQLHSYEAVAMLLRDVSRENLIKFLPDDSKWKYMNAAERKAAKAETAVTV